MGALSMLVVFCLLWMMGVLCIPAAQDAFRAHPDHIHRNDASAWKAEFAAGLARHEKQIEELLRAHAPHAAVQLDQSQHMAATSTTLAQKSHQRWTEDALFTHSKEQVQQFQAQEPFGSLDTVEKEITEGQNAGSTDMAHATTSLSESGPVEMVSRSFDGDSAKQSTPVFGRPLHLASETHEAVHDGNALAFEDTRWISNPFLASAEHRFSTCGLVLCGWLTLTVLCGSFQLYMYGRASSK